VVTEFEFSADKVTDLAPVQALVGLEYLRCNGSAPGEGRRADLSPLKDMKLINLSVYFTQVSDLSPLKGIKLGYLNCEATQVSDLSPLKDMKLWSAHVGVNKIADLSPLKGMPLAHLRCDFEPQRDAAILRSITTLKTLVLPTFLWARIVGRVI
jgi:Leucine-rich repeat (LRR) protein